MLPTLVINTLNLHSISSYNLTEDLSVDHRLSNLYNPQAILMLWTWAHPHYFSNPARVFTSTEYHKIPRMTVYKSAIGFLTLSILELTSSACRQHNTIKHFEKLEKYIMNNFSFSCNVFISFHMKIIIIVYVVIV